MKVNNVEIPTIEFSELFHVGDIDISEKQRNSYEGSGLSVSDCPKVWTRIARLGGRNTNRLTKEKGVFLNYHVLGTARKKIKKWGLEQGFIEKQDIYLVPGMNENGEEYYMTFINPEHAYEEYVEYVEFSLEEELTLSKEEILNNLRKSYYKAMPKLLKVSMRDHIGPMETIDLLVVAWAEQFTELDGVHWADILDEENLSAPRSVIFNNKVKDWKIEQL
ncbi:hypothetical protein ABD91_20845 [Lysinibacillus sphaericus]|uniref:hypothetical protein n=1 Tax=Lysinibacillus sphaericus TaxID=1421 RepID=UPI0018CD897B|nr:hypothetical protein [Lysinibacillus sphaericus]MBG9693191.1 hypothetical protein [Lysinibacillus sphaericus]